MRPFLCTLVVAQCLVAASVDGIPIHSSSIGKGPKPVVLVHGWTCDETIWTEQIPALVRQYRVIKLDLPGHGKSGSPKDGKFSMDPFARAVEAVRVEAKVERIVLVGHSMGTPVVVQYARLCPQHTAALVLVDGHVTMPAPLAGKPQQWMGEEGRKTREKMIRGMFVEATPPSVQAKVLTMMLAAPEVEQAEALRNTPKCSRCWSATNFPGPRVVKILVAPILRQPRVMFVHHARQQMGTAAGVRNRPRQPAIAPVERIPRRARTGSCIRTCPRVCACLIRSARPWLRSATPKRSSPGSGSRTTVTIK